MEDRIELVATCLFGLEKFLGEEIDSLGYGEAVVIHIDRIYRSVLCVCLQAVSALRGRAFLNNYVAISL